MRKVLASLAWRGGLAVLLISCARVKPDGQAETQKAVTAESAGVAILETARQIQAMSPCWATLEEREPCSALFRTADGKTFRIGSPAAPAEVVQFLGTLNTGEAYAFPGVFLDYPKRRD